MLHEDWQKYLAERGEPLPGAQPAVTAAAGALTVWLQDWAALRFRGADARGFLQGYLTSDTGALEVNRLHPTAICNLKGRVVVNGWCWGAGDTDVGMLVHASLVQRLADFLRPYLMFAKTRMEDETAHLLLLGMLDLPANQPANPTALMLDDRRCILPCSSLVDARDQWEQMAHAPQTTWQAALIEDGIPLLTRATSELFLPQMLGLDASGAVSFSKGCYLGQEVVARAQHRGAVKRHLRRLSWQGDRVLEPGQEIVDSSGRAVGVVVNAVGCQGQGSCLAVLHTGHFQGLRQGDTDLRGAA